MSDGKVGPCAKCGGLATCWCDMPKDESWSPPVPSGAPGPVDVVLWDLAWLQGYVADAMPGLLRNLKSRDTALSKIDATALALKSLGSELATLRAERARLTSAIRWALGEEGDFGESLPDGRYPGDGKEPKIGRYWWRTELRQRAGLGEG